jgi:hypothetical protein
MVSGVVQRPDFLTSRRNAPFGDWRRGTKAIDRTLVETAVELVQFPLNDFAHPGWICHRAEIKD